MRAAAAGAILAGSVAEGLSGSAALIAVLLGAMLFVVAGASARRRVRFRDLPPPPVEARYSTWWQSGLRAALPSTVIVSLLGAAALGFSPETAAVCAGLLAGMAILGLGVAVPLVREERRTRRRLYVDWSILQPRRFAGRQP